MGLLIHRIEKLPRPATPAEADPHIGGIRDVAISLEPITRVWIGVSFRNFRGAGARNHHLGEVEKLATDGDRDRPRKPGSHRCSSVYTRRILMGRHIVGAGRKRCASRKSRHIG